MAGRAIASRKGSGKNGHVAVNEPWLQEQVSNSKLVILKIKKKFNVVDLLTKYLTREEIEHIIDYLQHEYQGGRSSAAPELSIVGDGKPRCLYFSSVEIAFNFNPDDIQQASDGTTTNG